MKDESPRMGQPAVLFDIDGTLVDSVEMCLAGLGDSFEHFTGSRPSIEFLRSLVGQPLSDQMNLLGLGESDPDGLPQRIAYTINRYRVHQSLSRFFEPAIAAMHALQNAGFATGLVTSKNRQELEEFLTEHSEFGQIGVAVSSEHASKPKPAPDPVLYACEKLGVLPTRTIFVGDSSFDMACGRTAGVQIAAVTYGAGQRDVLASYSPEWLFDQPEQLLHWAHELILTYEKETDDRRDLDPCPA